MGILHVTKKKVPEVLSKRLAQSLIMTRRGHNLDQNDMDDISPGVYIKVDIQDY